MQHNEEIAQLYQDQVVDEDSYKSSIRILHSDAVREALDSYAPNRVLGTPPPEIHFSESLLPRPIRSELSRLRSGFSRKLNSYMSRIDTSIEDKCPLCTLLWNLRFWICDEGYEDCGGDRNNSE